MMLQGNLCGNLEIVSETKRVAQVTCHLEGDEELHDFVPGKRKLKEDQEKVRLGQLRLTSIPVLVSLMGIGGTFLRES